MREADLKSNNRQERMPYFRALRHTVMRKHFLSFELLQGKYWVGPKFRSGFSVRFLPKNPNELLGQHNSHRFRSNLITKRHRWQFLNRRYHFPFCLLPELMEALICQEGTFGFLPTSCMSNVKPASLVLAILLSSPPVLGI